MDIGTQNVENKIIVFKKGTRPSQRFEIYKKYGLAVEKNFRSLNIAICRAKRPEVFSLLSEEPWIESVEEDVSVYIQVIPESVKIYSLRGQEIPWGIEKLRAPECWKSFNGDEIRVGVIDTGVDATHPDLKENLKELMGTYKKNLISDDNGHGSHVSGTIAAVNNDIGVVGVAPKAKIISIKAFDKNGSGQLSGILEAIDWCIDSKVDVINMSFGISNDSNALKRVIKEAYDNGIVLVAAAGNNGKKDGVLYPAKYEEVMAVTACDRRGVFAPFSSQGKEVDFIAPGVDVLSCYNNGGYVLMSGTSMACPHVSGACALILSKKRIKPSELKEALARTARSLGYSKEKQGAGFIDVRKALSIIE
ncbi:S8 family peptidase [Thermovenabulum gondwanense]|uniref:Subtilisin E n=1 Tax=Thermovenabulum gondwanense TaxID=520767 RepID=A0A161PXE5_9FIRM|nr:S8 family peptidase [Thermovenabulum gondwanense]KYO66524.1 Subtilisin E [Thermovenabulum gondwanense]